MASRSARTALLALVALAFACEDPPGPPNDPPVTADDAYSVDEDQTLTVSGADSVLANDHDPEGGGLTAAIATGPTHGTVTIAPNGSFEYVPTADFYGNDSFTYQAHDERKAVAEGSVTIEVRPINDAPVPVADAYEAIEDQPLTVDAFGGVLANDGDVDGDILQTTVMVEPENGTLTLAADGAFSYQPDPDFNGSDSFSYSAADADGGVTATVELLVAPVDDPPVIALASYLGTEDVELSIAAPGVLVQTVDADGETVTAALDQAPAQGAVTLNADGSFDYVPAANDNGSVTFTFTVTDGVTTVGPETVVIVLSAVNDAPTAAADMFAATEDTALSIAAAAGVLDNDADVDGDAVTAELVTDPANGTLTFADDGSFDYDPNANFNGDDTFEYRITDGALASGTVTATIQVAPVNDRPVSLGDAYDLNEDEALSIAANDGLLQNDIDIEDDALTAVLEAGPTHGTLALDPDGSFTYTPDPNFFGTDTFTYRANDGALASIADTVTLTIAPVNDAPVAVGDDVYVLEHSGGTLTVDQLKANDTDVDGDAFTLAIEVNPLQGTLTDLGNGMWRYDPTDGFLGTDSFEYTLSDGLLQSASVEVTVHVLDKPDLLWARTVQSGEPDHVEDIAVASDGTVIAVGDFSGPSTTIAGQTVTSATDPTGFVVALDSAGSVQWIYTSPYRYRTVAAAPDGSVYVASYNPSTLTRLNSSGQEVWTLDDGPLKGRPLSLAALDDSSVVVGQLFNTTELQRFDTSGTEMWARNIKRVNVMEANALAAVGMDFVLVGQAFNNATFGKDEATETQLQQLRQYDTSPFIASYNGSDGTLRWVRHAPAPTGSPTVGQFSIAQESRANAVTAVSGGFVLTGTLEGTAEFGWDEANPVVHQTPAGASSFHERAFVASYSDTGAFRWAVMAESGVSRGQDILTRADGSVVLWAGMLSDTTLSSPDRSFTLTDGWGMFFAHYEADGALNWAWKATDGYFGATAAAVMPDGGIAACGNFDANNLQIAPNEPSAQLLTSMGPSIVRDGFLMRVDAW